MSEKEKKLKQYSAKKIAIKPETINHASDKKKLDSCFVKKMS